MKRIFCFILIIALVFLSLVSCSGYNKTTRDHLENADNYKTREVFLKDFYYVDPSSNEKKRDITNQAFFENDIIFEVSFFNTIEEIIPFLGGSPNEDVPLEEYKFQFLITKNNSNILSSNNFYNHITVGEKISVKVSDYTYMDSNFFYIAQLEYNGKEYLRFEDGLKNIADMMKQNKSLF